MNLTILKKKKILVLTFQRYTQKYLWIKYDVFTLKSSKGWQSGRVRVGSGTWIKEDWPRIDNY